MILLKRYWYEFRLKHLISKADYCVNPKLKKDINKKIYSLHIKLNEIEQLNTPDYQVNEELNQSH